MGSAPPTWGRSGPRAAARDAGPGRRPRPGPAPGGPNAALPPAADADDFGWEDALYPGRARRPGRAGRHRGDRARGPGRRRAAARPRSRRSVSEVTASARLRLLRPRRRPRRRRLGPRRGRRAAAERRRGEPAEVELADEGGRRIGLRSDEAEVEVTLAPRGEPAAQRRGSATPGGARGGGLHGDGPLHGRGRTLQCAGHLSRWSGDPLEGAGVLRHLAIEGAGDSLLVIVARGAPGRRPRRGGGRRLAARRRGRRRPPSARRCSRPSTTTAGRADPRRARALAEGDEQTPRCGDAGRRHAARRRRERTAVTRRRCCAAPSRAPRASAAT